MAQSIQLSANQNRALAALLTEPTVKAAAGRAGLCERTIYGYLSDPTFKAQLRSRQDAILASVTAGLVGLSGEAVATLRSVLTDPQTSDAVKVRAALGWLKHTREAVELQDLAERVSKLEQAIEGGADEL